MNVAKELRKLSQEPLEGIKVQLNEEDVTDVCAEITGPGAPPSDPAPRPRACARALLPFLSSGLIPPIHPEPCFPPVTSRLDALRERGVQGEAGPADGLPARAAQGCAPTPWRSVPLPLAWYSTA